MVHMFPPYIFTMSRSTPNQKSRREVRRRLVDLYSSNLLSMSANLPSPDHLLWPLTAVPHAGAMKELLFHYFRTFIRKRVQAMGDWCLGFCLVQCLLLFFSQTMLQAKCCNLKLCCKQTVRQALLFQANDLQRPGGAVRRKLRPPNTGGRIQGHTSLGEHKNLKRKSYQRKFPRETPSYGWFFNSQRS